MLRLVALVLLAFTSDAWITPSPSYTVNGRKSSFLFQSSETEGTNNVQVISLASLQDHEADGQRMAESIARWLDSEVREKRGQESRLLEDEDRFSYPTFLCVS